MNETHSPTSKDYQLYCDLANSKSTILPIPKHLRMKKRWGYAQTRSLHEPQKALNRTVEGKYHNLLTKVKQLLAGQPFPIFERDYRYDDSEDALALHAFISYSFYWYLECSYCYDYRISYAFNNCLFEAEVRALLRFHPFDLRATEVQLKPDFINFYKNVLKVQDRKYITL